MDMLIFIITVIFGCLAFLSNEEQQRSIFQVMFKRWCFGLAVAVIPTLIGLMVVPPDSEEPQWLIFVIGMFVLCGFTTMVWSVVRLVSDLRAKDMH